MCCFQVVKMFVTSNMNTNDVNLPSSNALLRVALFSYSLSSFDSLCGFETVSSLVQSAR